MFLPRNTFVTMVKDTQTSFKKQPAKKSKKQVVDPFDSSLSKVAKQVISASGPCLKRTTEDLFALAEQLGVDPFATLLYIADGNKLALSLDDESDKPITPELRAMAARECLKYMYPTMKSAEITGKDGASLAPQIVKILFDEGQVEGAN